MNNERPGLSLLPPPQAPRPALEGVLASDAARLLHQGFAAAWVRIDRVDGGARREGFVGDASRRAVLESLFELGSVAMAVPGLNTPPGLAPLSDTMADAVEVRLEHDRRLIFRHQRDESQGFIQHIWVVGEETAGPHRKSTNRNVRRLIRRLTRRPQA